MARMEDYRIRLVKPDGRKTAPVDVSLNRDWGEWDRRELDQHLKGLVAEHEDMAAQRHLGDYALEVLKRNSDEVVYRIGG